MGDVTLAAVEGVVTRVQETVFDGSLDLWARDAPKATTLLGAVTVRQTLSARAALFARADLARLSSSGTPVPPLPGTGGGVGKWQVEIGVVGLRSLAVSRWP